MSSHFTLGLRTFRVAGLTVGLLAAIIYRCSFSDDFAL